MSRSRGIRFSHIFEYPHVYWWKKNFEQPGGEISGQLTPYKIGQIILPHWYRKIDAAMATQVAGLISDILGNSTVGET